MKVYYCKAIVMYSDKSETIHEDLIVAKRSESASAKFCSHLTDKFPNSQNISVNATLYGNIVSVDE